MAKKPKKENTTMTEIANVLIEPSSIQGSTSGNYFAHFNETDDGNKTGRHKEKLPFQEWTAKYHQ